MENLSIWVSKSGSLLYLPLFLIWNIWKARNRKLFDDQNPIMAGLLHIIYDEVNTYKPLLKHRHKIRNIGKSPTSVFPMIFFDGAAATGPLSRLINVLDLGDIWGLQPNTAWTKPCTNRNGAIMYNEDFKTYQSVTLERI